MVKNAIGRNEIFNKDFEFYTREALQKRLVQTAITLAALTFPTCALLVPNQSSDRKLWELGLGSVIGACATYVARERDKIEKRYDSFTNLRSDYERANVSYEFDYEATRQKINRDINRAVEISKLPVYMQAKFGKDFQLSELLPALQKSAEPKELKQIDISLNGSVTPTRKPEITSDIEWILQLAAELTEPELNKRKHHHLIVHGGSQTGKSTFVSAVIILCSSLIAKQGVQTEVNLIDPKYPETDWFMEPQYKDYSEVLEGLQNSFDELQELKTKAKAAKKSLSNENGFRFIVVDEQDNIYGGGLGYPDKIDPKEAKQIINLEKTIIKEGASYNFCQIVIGQSPLNTDSGFNRQIYRNTTHIVLGDAAEGWCNDPKFPYKEHAQRLLNEISKYQRSKERFGMVMPKGGTPFITRMSSEIRQIVDYARSQNDEIKPNIDESMQDTELEVNETPIKDAKTGLECLIEIVKWYFRIFDERGHYPNDATLKQAWLEIKGEDLSEQALSDLRKLIHKYKEKNNESY